MTDAQNQFNIDPAIFGVLIAFILLLSLVLYVYFGFSYSKLLKKAGAEDSWAGWVPVYGSWRMFEIAGRPGWWSLIGSVAYALALISPIIYFIANILALVISIIFGLDLAKSFGKSSGYAVALIFFPVPMYLIMALDSDKYVGPGGKALPKKSTK